MKACLLIADCLVGAGFAFMLNWLALIPFRRLRGRHWTEQARVLYPARVSAGSQVWQIPTILVLGQRLLFGEEAPHWVLAALLGWAGVVAAGYFFSREVAPEVTARQWFHEVLAGWGLSFFWWSIIIGIAALMSVEMGWRNWALAGIYLAAVVVWAFGGVVWFGKKTKMHRPAPERLRSIVEEVSRRMMVPVRGVWLVQSAHSRAYALPWTKDLCFSSNVLDKFPDEEIAAITAHELGHFCEPRRVLYARLAGCLALAPFLFIKPWFHHSGIASVLIAASAYWIIRIWSQDLSRHMEVHADRRAKENEGDPGVYARALARFYEDNLTPAVLPQKHSHPDLYERLVGAGVTPNYPRPEPPDARSFYSKVLLVLLVVLAVMTLASLG